MQCTDCQTIDPAMTRSLDLSLSLAHVEKQAECKQRKNDVLEFLNRHIAGGFMRNKPGWIDYK